MNGMAVAPTLRQMDDKRHCVRCERAIDAYARICPYCNGDQSAPAPPPGSQAAAPAYVPPPDRTWHRYIKSGVGGIALIVAAFVIGFFVHGNEPPKNAPGPITEQSNNAGSPTMPRSAVTLVPVNDTSSIEQPITSAPIPNLAQGVPTEYQRSDATAVSSAEYAQLAERAKAEKKNALIDPRTLTGPAYSQAPPRREPDPVQTTESVATNDRAASATNDVAARVVVSTRPVPQYQPYPNVNVIEPATASLQLTIGPDGHVKEVEVVNGVPGQTAKIIQTVQTWRFKPATENGQPVTSRFGVDLSFKPDE